MIKTHGMTGSTNEFTSRIDKNFFKLLYCGNNGTSNDPIRVLISPSIRSA